MRETSEILPSHCQNARFGSDFCLFLPDFGYKSRFLARLEEVLVGNPPVPSEEFCQCPDCKRFYREHDRLIREYPTLRRQQELIWTSLQSFRTLAVRVLEEMQKEQEAQAVVSGEHATGSQEMGKKESAIAELENVNAYLFSVEALLERIFTVQLPESVEGKFREVSGELAPDPLNSDRLRLNRLLHQTPDLAECDRSEDPDQG